MNHEVVPDNFLRQKTQGAVADAWASDSGTFRSDGMDSAMWRHTQTSRRNCLREFGMTMPDERTKAVVETRNFLQLLAAAHEVAIPGLVQTVASGLLRHYPLDTDLDVSASALPGIWAHPIQK
jgi:hypothetical protein